MIRLAEVEPTTANNFNLIRMVAASGVLVSHTYSLALGRGTPEPLETLLGVSLGTLCVYVFFTVSGFFIMRSFDRSSSFKRFVMSRALRLFPALFVVLALTVVVGAMLTTLPQSSYWPGAARYFVEHFLMVQRDFTLPGVFEDLPFAGAVNGSLRTLHYEVRCYIGVAVLGLLGLRYGARVVAPFLVLFTLAYLIYVTGSFDVHFRIKHTLLLGYPFLVGVLFYLFRRQIPLNRFVAVGAVGVALLSLGTPLFKPLFIPALSYAVFVFGYWRVPRLLTYNRLGDYSYGTYVFAFPVQQLAAANGFVTPLANGLVAFPITLCLAIASWYLIEKPALSLKPKPKRDGVPQDAQPSDTQGIH